jgi:hypothetical protein
MRAHVIEDGVVVNTIEVDSLDFMPNLIEATEGGIGWSYSRGSFAAPEQTASEEELSVSARSRRDVLLRDSDWAVSTDAPTDKAAWQTYRQALRDVPQQEGFPQEVTWPEKPE